MSNESSGQRHHLPATHRSPLRTTFAVSVHTWAFCAVLDPERSFLNSLLHLLTSLAVVLIQIVVLIAIVNESTKITPCEKQDDCSAGTFCAFQDISFAFRNLAKRGTPPSQPVELDWVRRCWDCTYTQLGYLASTIPGVAETARATVSDNLTEVWYGTENKALMMRLHAEGSEKCLEEDRYPTRCDTLVHFLQTLTGANVLVLIVSAVLLCLPLIADFEQVGRVCLCALSHDAAL